MHIPRSTKHTSNPQKNVNKANTQLCQIDNSLKCQKSTDALNASPHQNRKCRDVALQRLPTRTAIVQTRPCVSNQNRKSTDTRPCVSNQNCKSTDTSNASHTRTARKQKRLKQLKPLKRLKPKK